MSPRVGLSVTALVVGAVLAAGPALAEPGWIYDNITSRFITANDLPQPKRGPYPSYMYSVIPPPHGAVVRLGAVAPASAVIVRSAPLATRPTPY
jgi:hypothetical protein